jgi:leucyl aminopeptidase
MLIKGISMSLDLNIASLLKSAKTQKSKSLKVGAKNLTIAIANHKSIKDLNKMLQTLLAPYQKQELKEKDQGIFNFQTPKGKLKIVILPEENWENIHHEGLLQDSNYALARDYVGEIITKENLGQYDKINIQAVDLFYDELLGSLLGIEIGAYGFVQKKFKGEVNVSYQGELPPQAQSEALQTAKVTGHGVNLARHLVNTAPSDKRPISYAKAVEGLFQKNTNMQVDIWDEKKLKKEKMGMILAVGRASVEAPRLVHLKYRPKNARDINPIAFVGKGITFDSGGLNIKPTGGMRLMKKDMGGSASLVGLAYWATHMKIDIPCDFYLSLAENSIDAHSFCPGDILTARNGKTVEIDNTDAEGRLVLGDALCVASEKKGKEKPLYLIDVATLTGAIKVGLGTDIAGLFSNCDELAFLLQSCSQVAGDKLWRMPLMPAQRKKLKSSVADMANSAGGFGGAIRAAMFLQEFTNDIPWAHLDIYAWTDGQSGPFAESGGNGQGVQCLAQFLSQL